MLNLGHYKTLCDFLNLPEVRFPEASHEPEVNLEGEAGKRAKKVLTKGRIKELRMLQARRRSSEVREFEKITQRLASPHWQVRYSDCLDRHFFLRVREELIRRIGGDFRRAFPNSMPRAQNYYDFTTGDLLDLLREQSAKIQGWASPGVHFPSLSLAFQSQLQQRVSMALGGEHHFSHEEELRNGKYNFKRYANDFASAVLENFGMTFDGLIIKECVGRCKDKKSTRCHKNWFVKYKAHKRAYCTKQCGLKMANISYRRRKSLSEKAHESS